MHGNYRSLLLSYLKNIKYNRGWFIGVNNWSVEGWPKLMYSNWEFTRHRKRPLGGGRVLDKLKDDPTEFNAWYIFLFMYIFTLPNLFSLSFPITGIDFWPISFFPNICLKKSIK